MCRLIAASNLLVVLSMIGQLHQKSVEAAKFVKYNNLICQLLDDELVELQYCRLKLVSRTQKAAQFKAIVKKDITEVSWHVRLMKRTNGWRSFFIDGQLETCDFLRHPNKYILQTMMFDLVRQFTSFNHTCPYKAGEAVILDLPTLDDKKLTSFWKILPFENGVYGVFINILVKGKLRGSINGSLTLTDTMRNK